MSSGEVRRVSRQDIQLVQNLIERCLQHYMNQQEVVQTLLDQEKIEPGFTECVWQKLEEENQDFFKAYHLRLVVKQQIIVFNKLLEQQVELMCQIQANRVASVSTSNGSHISKSSLTVQHDSTCFGSEQTRVSLKPEYLHSPVGSSLSDAITNGQSTMQTIMHITTHARRVNTPSNMLCSQCSDISIIQGMNGGAIKSEPSYYGNNPFMLSEDANDLETRTPTGNGSFNDVEANSQILNEPQTLLDADTSTYGYLGQIPRSFSLSELTADHSHSSVSDILENYSRSPFLIADTDSFVHSGGGHGNDRRLRTKSGYQNDRNS